jgi:heat shock protein HtpX
MNNFKTFMFMAVLAAVLVGIGYAIGGPGTAIVFLVMAGVMNFAMFWFSDKLVLRMSGAREVSPQEEPRLHKAVEEVVGLTGLPKPKVYMIQNDQPNAFATGRSPKHAVVAATTGIMRLLDERELRGVLAHEMAHIRNRDMLISTIVATFAGAITYIAWMLQWSLFFGGGRRSGNNALGSVALLATIILAPIAALLIRMAVSRAREYQADETGARLVHDPEALASALEKLHMGAQMRPMKESAAVEATAHLYIVNPLRPQGMAALFMTHPPLEKRVERLHQMARTGSYL